MTIATAITGLLGPKKPAAPRKSRSRQTLTSARRSSIVSSRTLETSASRFSVWRISSAGRSG